MENLKMENLIKVKKSVIGLKEEILDQMEILEDDGDDEIVILADQILQNIFVLLDERIKDARLEGMEKVVLDSGKTLHIERWFDLKKI